MPESETRMGIEVRSAFRALRGVTLIELIVYLNLAALLGIPLIMITLTSSRSSSEGSTLMKIQERNRTAVDRIIEEYRLALKNTTTISNGGLTLRFTSDGGFNGTTTIPGPIIRYQIQMGTGETANATDDNGNGLVDEGIIVRVNETTGEQITISGDINTQNSFFAANGTGIQINLSTFGHVPTTSVSSEVTRSVSVYPQN
jgi:hypothetical protein